MGERGDYSCGYKLVNEVSTRECDLHGTAFWNHPFALLLLGTPHLYRSQEFITYTHAKQLMLQLEQFHDVIYFHWFLLQQSLEVKNVVFLSPALWKESAALEVSKWSSSGFCSLQIAIAYYRGCHANIMRKYLWRNIVLGPKYIVRVSKWYFCHENAKASWYFAEILNLGDVTFIPVPGVWLPLKSWRMLLANQHQVTVSPAITPHI